MHGQFTAAAQGKTVDSRDQRFLESGDALPVRQARVVEDADQVALGHFLDIGTGGEGLGTAGDDHGADARIVFHGIQFGCQLTQQFGVQRVERLGALQGDQANGLVRVHGKGVRHENCPRRAWQRCRLE
ncbi:hypothetical protein D3C86_1746470 [compost metagenome]